MVILYQEESIWLFFNGCVKVTRPLYTHKALQGD